MEYIVSAIGKLLDESSAADPLPVSVMKRVAQELAPFLSHLFNPRWPLHGRLPLLFTSIIKKPAVLTNSNLSVVSKLPERVVADYLVSYLFIYLFYLFIYLFILTGYTEQKTASNTLPETKIN
jgi:hypothetical protein